MKRLQGSAPRLCASWKCIEESRLCGGADKSTYGLVYVWSRSPDGMRRALSCARLLEIHDSTTWKPKLS